MEHHVESIKFNPDLGIPDLNGRNIQVILKPINVDIRHRHGKEIHVREKSLARCVSGVQNSQKVAIFDNNFRSLRNGFAFDRNQGTSDQ